jgi:hypothetical protein
LAVTEFVRQQAHGGGSQPLRRGASTIHFAQQQIKLKRTVIGAHAGRPIMPSVIATDLASPPRAAPIRYDIVVRLPPQNVFQTCRFPARTVSRPSELHARRAKAADSIGAENVESLYAWRETSPAQCPQITRQARRLVK